MKTVRYKLREHFYLFVFYRTTSDSLLLKLQFPSISKVHAAEKNYFAIFAIFAI